MFVAVLRLTAAKPNHGVLCFGHGATAEEAITCIKQYNNGRLPANSEIIVGQMTHLVVMPKPIMEYALTPLKN